MAAAEVGGGTVAAIEAKTGTEGAIEGGQNGVGGTTATCGKAGSDSWRTNAVSTPDVSTQMGWDESR
jgi:hypothetical protein